MFDRRVASHTSRFIFNVIPESSVQNISVSMQLIQSYVGNSEKLIDSNSNYLDLQASNSLKSQPTSSIYDDKILEKWIAEMHLSKNVRIF